MTPLIAVCSKHLMIGEAAQRCGLTARAIRLYEARGLLHPQRNPRGARYYTPSDLRQLRLIASARCAGLSIRQIEELLHLGRRDGPAAQQQRIVSLCQAQIASLTAQMSELEALMRKAAHGDHTLRRRTA